ncbi:MAG: magnesium chelatase [Bacillota bacterium]|nr:magnesium chelatase [Bacillota bacterium]
MLGYQELIRFPGNQALFEAIEMSVLGTLCGRPLHLHAEGLRGTGKTTILRAARQVLPPILRIAGCVYNCHPDRPHCPEHRDLSREEVAALGTEWTAMPFLEITHSAKLGTVVGSIDLGRLTSPRGAQAALLPGTIPQAHRGIIFVDEINRLAETSPELTDVLLGVMGTKPGRVQIEETGLPVVSLDVNACVWAASNPDEDPGPLEDIRRQLADRFDLVVNMGRPAAPEAVRRVLEASDAWFRTGSVPGVCPRPAIPGLPDLDRNRTRWSHFMQWMPQVLVPDSLRGLIASLYVDFGFESLRAVEAWQLGARIHACLAGRKEAEVADFLAVAPLVLRHRVDMPTLSEVMARLDSPREPGGGAAEAQVPAAAPTQERGDTGLSQLFARARERLQALLGGEPGGGPGGRGARESRAGPAGTGTRGGGGASPMTDPLQAPIASPPAVARPLVELPLAAWVREE